MRVRHCANQVHPRYRGITPSSASFTTIARDTDVTATDARNLIFDSPLLCTPHATTRIISIASVSRPPRLDSCRAPSVRRGVFVRRSESPLGYSVPLFFAVTFATRVLRAFPSSFRPRRYCASLSFLMRIINVTLRRTDLRYI